MSGGHEVVRTRNGAVAMRSLVDGELMHPGVGPLAEAEELYVRQSRLVNRLATGPVVLFDVGLGAGSNAVAARRAAVGDARLELVSFERDLGALELALTAPHAADFGLDGEHGEAARALLAAGCHESACVRWHLRRGELLERLADEPLRADIVFWDPFSPRANPLLWTVAAFTAMRRVAGPRCTLYTYSASTAVRAALLLAGWSVGLGAPIGAKAHTTAAAVCVDDVARPLDRPWLRRLGRADVPLPPDADRAALARIELLPQFA